MDFFGIGQAVKGCVATYFQCARGTGRTNSMIESLKDGDRVIFTNRNEADRVKRMARELGVSIETMVKNPAQFTISDIGTSQGKTVFDHSFVEEYHRIGIERSIKDIDQMQEHLSGYGVKHVETKLKAKEMKMWRLPL